MIDGTIAAQKALSAIMRTGQRFGTEHLTKMLIGDATDAIRKFGHDRLPTFGVGKEFGKQEWRSIFRQLHGAGIMALDITGYGTWSVTDAGRRVLKGADKVTLRKDTLKPATRKTARAAANAAALAERRGRRHGVVRGAAPAPLRARQGAARRGLCRVRRQDLDRHGPAQADDNAAEMSAVHGVGEAKLRQYGADFPRRDPPARERPARKRRRNSRANWAGFAHGSALLHRTAHYVSNAAISPGARGFSAISVPIKSKSRLNPKGLCRPSRRLRVLRKTPFPPAQAPS